MGIIDDFVSALKPEEESAPNKTYNATVSKVDDEGIVWVYVAGSDKETPTASTSAEIKRGDSVNVEWRNNKLYIAGNYSNPSAGTERVVRVEAAAQNAENAANNAEATAQSAQASAAAAHQIAADTEQHFWFTETGADTGAHITEVTQEEWNDSNSPNYHSGGNLLARSNGIAVREGLKELATMSQSGFDAKTYDSNDNEVVIAHLGYGPGNDSGGGASEAPYYTLGMRATGSQVGNYSVAEGDAVIAAGYASHAEGQDVTASGTRSHAEGALTTASGRNSHAEGVNATASGIDSHAEGNVTTASGDSSHAEGAFTTASGKNSHAQNRYTKAASDYQTALGKYNIEDNADTYAVIVGNGTADNARSNALTVNWNGDVSISGDITVGGHSSAIGDRQYRNTDTTKASGTTWTSVSTTSVYATLDKGVWLIIGYAEFASNATGVRALRLYNDTDSLSLASTEDVRPAVSGSATRIQSVKTLAVSSTKTIVLQVYQNSGSTLNVSYGIEAVRIA